MSSQLTHAKTNPFNNSSETYGIRLNHIFWRKTNYDEDENGNLISPYSLTNKRGKRFYNELFEMAKKYLFNDQRRAKQIAMRYYNRYFDQALLKGDKTELELKLICEEAKEQICEDLEEDENIIFKYDMYNAGNCELRCRYEGPRTYTR